MTRTRRCMTLTMVSSVTALLRPHPDNLDRINGHHALRLVPHRGEARVCIPVSVPRSIAIWISTDCLQTWTRLGPD